MTTFAVHKPSATTSLRWEQSLWVATYLWVLCKVLQEGRTLFNSGLLIVWTLFILGGWALLQHSSDDAANFKSPLSAEKSSPAQSSSDPFDSETLSSPTTQKLKSNLSETVATSNKVGLYGSDKSSLRPSADDGSLCGLLMLPMVALAKVQDVALRESDDFHTARVHAKLELIMLTGTIFIILLLINRYLQPFRRTFRKRGLLLLTIVVSTFFTYLTTRLLAVTPALSNIPAIMTILTIVSFQWSLYICAVALKKCFTLGEMCILSQAASIVVYGSLEYIAISVFPNDLPDFLLAQEINNESVLSYAVVLGMAFIGIAVYPLLRQSRRLAQKPYWRMSPSSYTASDIHKRRVTIAIAVYTLTAIIVFFGIGPLCHRIMRENPFLWVLSFVFLSLSRLSLCVYWAMAVAVTVVVWVLVLDFTSSNAQQSSMFSNDVESKTLTSTLNKKRKLFHGLAVAMFVPGVLFEVSFMRLAFAVALSAFMFLEYLRYFAIWPYGKNIHMFLTEFIDNRDLGPVILSHIYLLLGCAGPVWLEGSNLLATMSGIISLGFGDTAASLAGKKFGRHRWPGSKKSIEGTVAFIMAVYISSLLVLYSSALLGVTGSKGILASIGKTEWLLFFVTSILTALLEAFSLQNDNIIVPLYMYTLVTMTFRA